MESLSNELSSRQLLNLVLDTSGYDYDILFIVRILLIVIQS